MAQTQQSHPGFVSMRQDIERRVRLYNESQTLFGSGGGLMTLTFGEGSIATPARASRSRRRTSARGHRRSTASTLQPVAVVGQQQTKRKTTGSSALSRAAKARWKQIRAIQAANPGMTSLQAQAQYKAQHQKAA